MGEGEGEKYLNFPSSAINNSEQESVITRDLRQQLSSLELLRYTTSQQLQQLQQRPQKGKPVRLQSQPWCQAMMEHKVIGYQSATEESR